MHTIKKIFILLFMFVASVVFSQTTFTVDLSSSGSSAWTVPCGVTSITVHCWGGGGAGGSATVDKTGAGGGGAGGYGTSVFAVTAGSSIAYTVGAGAASTPTNSTSQGASGGATTFSTLVANGGTGGNWGGNGASGGTFGTGGAGGTAVGTTTTTGGAGANGTAGASSTGGTGGAAGGPGGGAGGTSSAGGAGGTGISPGGGGGGGSQQAGPGGLGNFGGGGGTGAIKIIYTVPFTVNAGTDITLATCTTTNVTLAAATLSAGTTGVWSTGASSMSITNPTQTNGTAAGASFTEGASISFIWTVTNGTCSYQDEVIVTVPVCAQQNSTCATAMSLTANAALKCGQSTSLTVGDGTENCKVSGTAPAVWYKVTATNDSMVLNILGTSTYAPSYAVFASCPANCTSPAPITYSLSAGDPGKHTLLTGLTIGNTYYIEVQGYVSTVNSTFCISVNDMAKNSVAPIQATSIGTCGVTYAGTTNGGYYASTTSNMDNDASNEVTFVINNISWFKFCPSAASTYSVTFDVSSCVFSGVNSGSQMAILTGTVGATQATTTLTPIWQAPNPTYASDPAVSSPTFAVAAGACVYMLVDGFAGDACSYSYVVNPVGSTCLLLPIELVHFKVVPGKGVVDISWMTASEDDNDFYTVERSSDAIYFEELKNVDGSGNSSVMKNYYVVDNNPLPGISYYRLKQTDFSGKYTYSEIRSVEFDKSSKFEVNIFPNPISDSETDLNISLSSKRNDIVDIVIMNSTGTVVADKNYIMENSNVLVVVKHNFEAGVYFVKITNKYGETVTKKVFVK